MPGISLDQPYTIIAPTPSSHQPGLKVRGMMFRCKRAREREREIRVLVRFGEDEWHGKRTLY